MLSTLINTSPFLGGGRLTFASCSVSDEPCAGWIQRRAELLVDMLNAFSQELKQV